MEVIEEVNKERLRFTSKGFTSIMVAFFIALPVLLIFSMMPRTSNFDLTAILGLQQLQNATTTGLGLDSSYESSQPSSILPDVQVLNDSVPERFGNTSDSKYEPSQPTGVPDGELLDRTLAPRIDKLSASKDEFFEPTSMQNEDLLTEAPPPPPPLSNGEKSGSGDNSFQSTSIADDTLLDGLITSGFDEGSCLSRYESVRYRRISPHKPSPFLLEKLRKYEKLHARCGPHTKLYAKTVKGLVENHISSPSVCKYVIWRPVNGLGNRMISMISSFLYALLTNRVFLVYEGTDMANLFCEPFPNTSWLLPMDFPLKNQVHRSEKYSISKSAESKRSFVHLTLQKHDSLDKRYFFCDQGQALIRKVPWVALLSEQYFAPSFFVMPSFEKEVSRMFPNKETVFHHLGRYLFSPSNHVWQQLITKFYDAYLAKADVKIGLQIRVFHANAKMFNITMDQILACNSKAKLIPEIDTKTSSSSKTRKSSKAILVTSLYSEFYKNLSDTYSGKLTAAGEVISVYQPSHEGYQHRGDNVHNMKAWAEMYLLSLCDVLVTSSWSTFGYVAQGLGGLKPWILHRHGKGTYQPCKRAMSMEPCFHYPSSYDCKSENKINAGAVVPYIRKCEDRESGVKLFDRH
ncbi:galactoside 2-alpha-L-fucosyltransferase-like [Euphorbia lathyris]|uniref:galactoside 2-alpha-L-fucosyltransferase-like n=1 Tax=Euphorbia lathyris TaxID=212925 RepID=UPI003313C5BD